MSYRNLLSCMKSIQANSSAIYISDLALIFFVAIVSYLMFIESADSSPDSKSSNLKIETIHNDIFEYELEMSKNDELCTHMQKLYNEKFKRPWKSDPYYPSSLPKSYNHPALYADGSKYSWPKLSVTKDENTQDIYNSSLQERRNYAMRYSKIPSSEEFESIKWIDISVGLYANIDIDNDNEREQVVKTGFMGNVNKSGVGDYILIFKNGTLEFDENDIKKPLQVAKNESLAEDAIYEWRQIRPFTYKQTVYLHLEHDIADEIPNSQHLPEKSYTLVAKYYGDNDVKSWIPTLNDKMKGDDARFNNKVFAEGIIMQNTPGIEKICRFYMKPI